MDLNYLFSRHQLSLMSADATTSPEARLAHLGLAAGYAARIRDHRLDGRAEAPLSDAF